MQKTPEFSNEDIDRLRRRESTGGPLEKNVQKARLLAQNPLLGIFLNIGNLPPQTWAVGMFEQFLPVNEEITTYLDNPNWGKEVSNLLGSYLLETGDFFIPGTTQETVYGVLTHLIELGYAQGGHNLDPAKRPEDPFLLVIPDIEARLQEMEIIPASEQPITGSRLRLMSIINRGIAIKREQQEKERQHEAPGPLALGTPPSPWEETLSPDAPEWLHTLLNAAFKHFHPLSQAPVPPEFYDAFPDGIQGIEDVVPSRRYGVPRLFHDAFPDTGIQGIDRLPPPPNNK